MDILYVHDFAHLTKTMYAFLFVNGPQSTKDASCSLPTYVTELKIIGSI